MSQFSYSFCLSLFHSLWQSALLLALYAVMQPFIKKQQPSFKRNILYGLLFAQVIISGITFFIYYSYSLASYTDMIKAGFSALFLKKTFIEKCAPWITGLYASVIFFKMIHLIYNWFRFKRSSSTALLKPSVDLKLFTLIKANEFGIHRKVMLWLSHAVSTPVTFGFLKPVILMPVALLNHLSIADTESLIIHELTHIKNNDYLLNWLLVITETLFFFNPAIKVISTRIKLEREKDCDVQVLQFKYPPVSYAETLLKTAKFRTSVHFFPLAAVFKNKQLLQRILFFTSDQNLAFSKRKYSAVAVPVIITALLFNLFLLALIKDHGSDKHIPTGIPQVIQRIPDHDPVRAEFTARFPEAIPAAQPVAISILNKQIAMPDQQSGKLHVTVKVTTDEQAMETAIEESPEENYAVHAADVQNAEKEMIVREEASGTGEAITRTYKLKLKNGKWQNQLLYVMKEGRPANDSICYLKDSAMLKYIPAMQ